MRNLNVIKLVFISFALVVGGVVNGAEVSLTAKAIMEESWQTMGVAAHYRIASQGMEMSVYQKPLPDGSLAMLTDVSSPLKKTTIMYGDKSYDLYLDKKVAVDTHVLFAGAKSQPNVSPLLTALRDVKTEMILNRTFAYNGRECYEIEQAIHFSSPMLASLPVAMTRNIPVKNRFVVDAETFFILEKESFASNGSSISKLRYLDFEPMPNLTDDIFQLPGGFEVLSPKSIEEYVTITGSLLVPKPDIKRLPLLVASLPDLTLPNRFNVSDDEFYLSPDKKRNRVLVIVVHVIIISLIIIRLFWLYWRKNIPNKAE